MRLHHLKIDQFKNLKNFEIHFDKESPYTILVGQNGSGKSNLLEALVCIFSALDRKVDAYFGYEITYLCRGRNINIQFDPSKERGKTQITVDGKSKALTAFRELAETPKNRLMPEFLLGYYSGPGNRFEEHFYPHQRAFDKDLRDGVEEPLRPLFYAQMVHSQFVLLAFFANKDKDMKKFLADYLGIDSLVSIRFTLKKPYWFDPKRHEGRYWGAVGKVQNFLDDLYNWADEPVREDLPEKIDFRRGGTVPCVHLNFKSEGHFLKFAEDTSRRHDFFKMLESTYMADLLHSVTVTVKLSSGEVITFTELSEGEQQLLVVLGLLRFTRQEESLFLLDEPDTHLNPAWSIRYLRMIERVVGKQPKNHIIMATHDPLVIIDLENTQVQVLRRNVVNDHITAEFSKFDPKEMGIDGLLTSELFGLHAPIGLQVQDMINKRAALLAKGKNASSKDKGELRKITEELDGMGFANVFTDPIYTQFVASMGRRPEFMKPILSPAEMAEQEKFADKVLAKIMKEEMPDDPH